MGLPLWHPPFLLSVLLSLFFIETIAEFPGCSNFFYPHKCPRGFEGDYICERVCVAGACNAFWGDQATKCNVEKFGTLGCSFSVNDGKPGVAEFK